MDSGARSSPEKIPSSNQNAIWTSGYHSWGRYPQVKHGAVYRPSWTDEVPGILQQAPPASLLPYGFGRSYGDSCLNEGRALIDCSQLNRILAFDANSGLLCCEAGVSLADILDIAVPRGWFLPVTPGTKFVTLAGAIANDIHGKNHHRAGAFGNHVNRLHLHRSDRGTIVCSRSENRELFSATIGGLGLTGVILSAEIQMKPIQGNSIEVEAIPFHSLDRFIAISNESDDAFEYTVAWIDCFSGNHPRGIFFRGNHAGRDTKRSKRACPTVPFALPSWLLNRWTLQLFNSAYYRRSSWKQGKRIVHFDPFFYPLDSVLRWNLIYGKRGFVQHQCVVPNSASTAIEEMLLLIRKSGLGSFLAVLKRFGNRPSPGLLSFPRPGLTLALDFPLRGDLAFRLLESLDKIVLQSGGAVYPAKDARMDHAMFEASFPHWHDLRRFVDPKLSSSFWRRVTGE